MKGARSLEARGARPVQQVVADWACVQGRNSALTQDPYTQSASSMASAVLASMAPGASTAKAVTVPSSTIMA